MSFMALTTLIDLTHELESGMPVFPGSKPVTFIQESTLNTEHFNEMRLNISTHTGTHIDCGHHLFTGGNSTSAMPPGSFFGPGMVIDCRHFPSEENITRDYLQKLEIPIRSSEFILLHTGWSRYWGTPQYFSRFPVMSEEAASYLASFRLKGIGCDAISFDPVDSESLPVHHILLSSGLILIENLVNLEKLSESGFIFSCLPLRIKDGDGSPVRAVGIMTGNGNR
jgi:kynurenine formamidase